MEGNVKSFDDYPHCSHGLSCSFVKRLRWMTTVPSSSLPKYCIKPLLWVHFGAGFAVHLRKPSRTIDTRPSPLLEQNRPKTSPWILFGISYCFRSPSQHGLGVVVIGVSVGIYHHQWCEHQVFHYNSSPIREGWLANNGNVDARCCTAQASRQYYSKYWCMKCKSEFVDHAQ